MGMRWLNRGIGPDSWGEEAESWELKASEEWNEND